MNMKVLVETLIEIPDKDLLEELAAEVNKHKAIMLPDIKRFFQMLFCLFSGTDRALKLRCIQIYRDTFAFLLKTEIELSWNEVSMGVIRMLGEEDAEIRKKAKDLMMEIIDTTNNANIILDKLYYDGLENESVLTMISSMKCIFSVLELYPTVLQNKTSIRVLKLILEKLIAISMASKHIELTKNAKEFLEKLFYLKIEKLDDVLLLMNEKVLEYLENIWLKHKELMMVKEKEEAEREIKVAVEVKYEHLPLINGKIFGIYEPYVLKNIFNPDIQAARYLAITHFQEVFEIHFEELQKYLNVIYKVILKFVSGYHYNLLMMLKRIVHSPGIANIVNLSTLPSMIVSQLATENVPYRRELRVVFQKLHYEVPKVCLRVYEQELDENKNMGWIEMHEIINLMEHWVDNNMEGSYPPTLDKVLEVLCINLHSLHIKVKEKSLDLLLIILDRYPGYRENLEDHFEEEKICEIEDLIEKRKNKGRGNAIAQEAEEIFIREYEEERKRFIEHTKHN